MEETEGLRPGLPTRLHREQPEPRGLHPAGRREKSTDLGIRRTSVPANTIPRPSHIDPPTRNVDSSYLTPGPCSVRPPRGGADPESRDCPSACSSPVRSSTRARWSRQLVEMVEEPPAPHYGALTGEEEAARAAADTCARQADWGNAFAHLQRLLALVRARRDAKALARALEEFARLQEAAGDGPAARRTRSYLGGRFR